MVIAPAVIAIHVSVFSSQHRALNARTFQRFSRFGM
jgi:hypothetical protein